MERWSRDKNWVKTHRRCHSVVKHGIDLKRASQRRNFIDCLHLREFGQLCRNTTTLKFNISATSAFQAQSVILDIHHSSPAAGRTLKKVMIWKHLCDLIIIIPVSVTGGGAVTLTLAFSSMCNPHTHTHPGTCSISPWDGAATLPSLIQLGLPVVL